ncbi:unnamed protein product [Orchesella dallaii]|uniref:Uncharacterized protein n=1 Tax=Orchesella dallaii TaxID=48710 RepID=A0ABP1S1U9_9HEXA
MAVNSYNPRLGFGSTSSENDVEEIFHKFGGVGQNPIAMKNRSISEPVYNGRDLKKEASGRLPALSDSSNVLKRSGLPSHSKIVIGQKAGCSTICEELSQSALVEIIDGYSKSDMEATFPEPESMREWTRQSPGFMLEKEEETRRQDPEEVDEIENDPMLMRDVVFESEDFHQIAAEVAEVDNVEEDDDDNYPEIEHYPSGYGSFIYDDSPMSIFTTETGRFVTRSCDESFPELPDDILNTDSSYFTDYEYDMTPAEISEETSIPAAPHQMKVVLGEDW